MANNGDGICSRGQGGGNFVNYLPQDEAVAIGLGADEGGLDPLESQRVVDLLNRELSRLLKLNPTDFWRQVASDTSLHEFLDSFLQFRHRWYDFPQHEAKGLVAGVIVGEAELSRRVLMVLYRISSTNEPSGKASASLSPNDHSVLLQEKKLLNLPKLLDICAIYGHENRDLVTSLVYNAFKAQSEIHENFTSVMSQFLSIVHTMQQRCSSSLEVLLTSGSSRDHIPSRLHADYLEVMDFINDAVMSMDSLVSVHKPAAIVFACPVKLSNGDEELLRTLANLHDSLLPCLLRGFQLIYMDQESTSDKLNGGTLLETAFSIKMLSNNLVQFAWNLLEVCYLSDEVFRSDLRLPESMKMFPAMIEDSAIRADVLIQTLREINENMQHIELNHNIGTFLHNMDQNHDLVGHIEDLRNAGWISMENEQLQFLFGITRHERNVVASNLLSQSSSMSISGGKKEEEAAIIESKISQVKDLFPEYGKGFLSACLEVYNHNPEEVIQRILEGTLHGDLQSLDTTLDKMPPKSSAASAGRKDKGKGILVEPPVLSANSTVFSDKWTESQPTLSAQAGRFVRKARIDSNSPVNLDSWDERDLAKNTALVSQYEYNDEYDDSFDDLGLNIADSGLEENEALRDKLIPKADDSNPSDCAKWGSRKKPQFYVKDGKNYSYKVEGAIAVANTGEASLISQAQKEMIHGLGRGGNLPLGAVKKLTDLHKQVEKQDNQSDGTDGGSRGNQRGRGRRGGRGNFASSFGSKTDDSDRQNDQHGSAETGGRSNLSFSRGRGGRGHNHNRKDGSLKKHFSGVSGY
uniref:CUE domain-containing protein n=1 Tax=Kalanchoe fedtschenkoi TaxID=63787 RepID=A0A7N0UK89_KALFE